MVEFSFIVPVYKVEDCLERCVDSLLSQKYDQDKIEIILVDDGSPDRSGEICDRYAQEHQNIRAIHKENGGLSDARNFGLKQATKEYVIFLDSDDYVSPDTCRNFAETIAKSGVPCDIVTGGVEKIQGEKKALHNIEALPSDVLTGEEYLLNRLRSGKWYVAAWSRAYRREFLLKNQLWFVKGILHEDEEFSPRAFLKAESVACCGAVFYYYIIRENSITTAKNKVKNGKDIFFICNSLDAVYEKIQNPELQRLLKTHSAKIAFRAVEEAKLYLNENKQYIDKKILKKCCFEPKEKLRYMLLCISPQLLHAFQKII